MNKPHAREKRVVEETVKVVKQPAEAKEAVEKANTIINFLRKVIKK